MSESNEPPVEPEPIAKPPATALQFDQAEFYSPLPTNLVCRICQKPIEEVYYELGGQIGCYKCHVSVERMLQGGSPAARVIKAMLFGTGAAIAGAILFFVILRLTGSYFGLIAILVGFMVGKSVRIGSGHRGGRLYQVMAVGFCYLAIVWMGVASEMEQIYHPQINEVETRKFVDEINREIDKARAERRDGRKAEGQKELEDDNDAHHIAFLPPVSPPQPGPGKFLRLFARRTVQKIDSPIKLAISRPISGFIFAIALWEAWKLNFAAALAFNGPFRLSRKRETGPAAEGGSHDA